MRQLGKKIPGTNQRGMTRAQINRELRRVPTWEAADEDARKAFAEATSDVRYGHEALLDAWVWFHYGWKAQAAAVAARG